MRRHALRIAFVAAMPLAACGRADTQGRNVDASWDADNNGGLTDPDTGTETSCPMDSGWPCPCTDPAGDCEDGSDCIVVTGFGGPFCSPECEGPGAECPPTPWPAEPYCGLADSYGNRWCVLRCEENTDCPPGQTCMSTDVSYSICQP